MVPVEVPAVLPPELLEDPEPEEGLELEDGFELEEELEELPPLAVTDMYSRLQ